MSGALRVCSYEDRAEAMDGLILMAESLCRADSGISLHLSVPDAPASIRAWAKRRPEVTLSSERPQGVSGWDVKPRLLLQELASGQTEALWLDSDMIVTRSVSRIVAEFPRDYLILAEEWNCPRPERVADLWGIPSARAVAPVNSCFVRVTQAHRPLLQRWLEMTREPLYREAQTLPFERRPFHLISDQVLLTALLCMEEFAGVRLDRIRMGRHIAQCAGSSGYRPMDRLKDLFRGLPALIHCIGRKPWESVEEQSWALNLASDVSAYVLAARRVAGDLGMAPQWIPARTWLGRMLRQTAGGHPALAGFPLALPHAAWRKIASIGDRGPGLATDDVGIGPR
jgi:hypothetical protein